MRRLTPLFLAGSLTMTAAAVLLAPIAQAVPTPTGGTYTPLKREVRVVDTRTGAMANHKGAVTAGHGILPRIAGQLNHGDTYVPEDADAAVATISVVGPTGSGGLVAYSGTRPGTVNLEFTKGHSATTTAILPLQSLRTTLFNTAGSGSVHVVVDITGYVEGGAAPADVPGILHRVQPTRVVDTTTGAMGNHFGALPAGHGIEPWLGGLAGIPLDAGEVAVTITARDVRQAGTIYGYRPDEPKQRFALLHFTPGQRSSSFAVLRLDAGRVDLVNSSAGTVNISVDVAGWYDAGFVTTRNTFQSLVPTRLQTLAVPARTSRSVAVRGKGGVYGGDVSAALVTVHAVNPSKSGGLRVWDSRAFSPGNGTVLTFTAKQTTSDMIYAPVQPDGAFQVYNNSDAAVTVVVDVSGYVYAKTDPLAYRTDPARIMRNISGTAAIDGPTLKAEGQSDGEQDREPLLFVGSQTDNGLGIRSSGTMHTVSYPDLVVALQAYLDGYALGVGRPDAPGGGQVTVLTDNGGTDWTSYSPTERGTDWWTEVVSKLTPATDVQVYGGISVDPTDGTRSYGDVAGWKTAYVATHSEVQRPGLVAGATGCPVTWTSGGTCTSGWTRQQWHTLATGTLLVPTAGVEGDVARWAGIDSSGPEPLDFQGVLGVHALDANSLTTDQAAAGFILGLRGAGSDVYVAQIDS